MSSYHKIFLISAFILLGLSSASFASAATQIYRSVAPGATAALATDSSHANTITLASGTATFNVALPDNIGVGDAVLIDTGGTDQTIDASDTLLFISARTSSTVYTLQTQTGAVPADIAVNDTYSIYRAYTSLSNAEAGTKNTSIPITFTGGDRDLVANNEQWNIACYARNTTAADTASVVVNGWTTDATRYVKIYTPVTTAEVGTSQRHQGKWDSGKYAIEASASSNTISVYSSFTIIEGLQIQTKTVPNGGYNAISVNVGASSTIIRSNIVKCGKPTQVSQSGIIVLASGLSTFIYDNIIYDFQSAGSVAVYAQGGTSYASNNTVINSATGYFSGYSAVAKNNISQGCTMGYTTTFLAGSTNNISQDATAPGTNPKTNTTVAFADATNKDFHLAPTDTAAKNAGADLSADANLPFTTDIDGQTRSASPGWDIGADEAANAVYYSVGQSTSDLKTGTPNVSITAGVATFDVAQTGNIGVGDVMVANAISYYIASKTSTTVWNVVTATGATPADITSTAVTSIKHVYSSLNSAVTGAGTLLGTTNLYTNNYQLNIPCYYDSGADTTAVTVSGYTTAVPNYIRIYTPVSTSTEANNSQRHSGKWDAGKYNLYNVGNTSNMLTVNNDYTSIQGMQLSSPTQSLNAINVNAKNVYLIGNIIKNFSEGLRLVYSASNNSMIVVGNIFYNNGGYCIHTYSFATNYIYNNTCSNTPTGFIAEYTTGNLYKNNIAQGCTDGYAGIFNTSSDYNISNLSSDTTGGAHDKQATVSFISTTTSAEDFHLSSSDTAARNSGADLSADTNLAFSTDIDGQTRNLNSLGWDIGADEGANQIYYSVGQNTTDHKTGTPNVTVSGTTATFDTAQTATNMGVGDLVTYAGGTCYIAGKNSTTVWNCVSATGDTPTAVSGAAVTSITHAFASLEGAVDANNANGAHDSSHLNTTDLFTNNYQLNIPCYYDTGADTAAVTVRSWTTRVQNYVKIYTPNNATSEVNQTQRHSGKWDATKYRLELSGQWTRVLIVSENFATIEGLQMYNYYTGSSGEPGCINVTSNGNTTEIKISNNILRLNRGYAGDSSYAAGVRLSLSSANYTFKVWDNVIYDTYFGIFMQYNAIGNFIIYNNTIYNVGGYGLRYDRDAIAAGYLYLKNNSVSHSAVSDYYGGITSSFWAATQVFNNLSSDATSPNSGATDCGGHSCRNQTVNFISTTSGSEDFHLSPTDTAAKNSGADLSADTYLPFSTDIDGAGRNAAVNAWDIGADETATQIFRSIAPSATAVLESDTSHARTVTLTSGTATFSNALADNIGVGDAVLIDTSNDNTITAADTLLFISARTDSTHYTLQAATGAVPSDITINDTYSIYRAYTSLSNAEAGTKNTSIPITFNGGNRDLVTNNEQWNIACYANGTTADTTAVLISDWTTAQQDYIKIYTPVGSTEVGTSQRHNGKWDDGKYRLQVTNNGAINLRSAWVAVDGLQTKVIANLADISVYGMGSEGSGGYEFKMSNNIIQGNISNNAFAQGVQINNIGISSAKIYNNIIYGFNYSSRNQGIGATNSLRVLYLHNNTIYSNYYGIKQVYSTAVIKNNISYNNTIDYSGTFDASSTNNLSKDATAPPYNTYYTNKNLTFTSTTSGSEDFHLVATDTDAINKGADLSADTNLPFTTDIDGQTRSATPGWDIGADEAANAVYYSVGQSTSDLKTGTPNVAITSGVATFDTAQTGNIGVGDVIVANSISYYIASKTSTTVWNVVTNTGATPGNITSTAVTSIKHVYSSLNSAATGAGTLLGTTDLYTNNYQINLPCYYDSGADTTAVAVSGYTTAVPNYIKIYTPYNTATEANNSQRHGGKWDSGKYNLSTTVAAIYIFSSVDNIRINGLQITVTASDIRSGIQFTGNKTVNLQISNNIIRGINATQSMGITANGTVGLTNGNVNIWNNIVYNFAYGFRGGNGLMKNYLYNNTIYGCNRGISPAQSGNTLVLKNNAVYNNVDNYQNYIDGYDTVNSSNNLSGPGTDIDMPGSNNKNGVTIQFVDMVNADLHLGYVDTAAKDAGTDLSADANFRFNTDIDGQVREANKWDIGADEFWGAQTGGPANGQSVISVPPIASYDFDEGYGTLAHNAGSGGAALNGTPNAGAGGTNTTTAAMWDKNGRFGGGMEFDGTDDRMTISNFQFPISNKFSISKWLNFQTLATAKPIFSQWGNSQNNVLIKSDDSSSNQLRICIASSLTDNCTNYAYTTDANLATGNWYNTNVVYDGTQSTNDTKLKLYINGIQKTLTFSGTIPATLQNPTSTLEIGGDTDLAAYMTGKLDDVKIFNYALSADQIKTLYNNNSAMAIGNDASRNNNGTTVTGAAKDYCIPGDTAQCDKPVGEWKMDEKVAGDVKTINDTSGNGNNGTTHYGANASGMDCTVPGKFGSACGFDGVDDYVDATLDGTSLTQFSLSLWVKPAGIAAGQRGIFQWATALSSGVPYILIARSPSSNNITFYVDANYRLSTPINNNVWTHIELTFNTSNLWTFYINGVNAGTYQDDANHSLQAFASKVWFGNGFSGYFNGAIDQAQIFNYTRTPAQVAWDYNRGKPVVEWRMDENVSGDAKTLHDEPSNSFNGTTHYGANATGMDCTVTGKFGKACSFDGTDDYVGIGTAISNVNAVSFWIKPASTTQSILDLDGGTHKISLAAGVVTATGFDTYYVDGKLNGAVSDTNWHQITAIANASFNTTTGMVIGKIDAAYFSGQIDNVKIFNYALTSLQVNAEYNNGAAAGF